MAKYEVKTKKNNKSVASFLNSVEDPKKRKQAKELNKIFKEITTEKPKMWGTSIVGYGEYHYKYASGREGDWMITGFSPRKSNLTVYIMPGYDLMQDDLKKLSKVKNGKSCLYIKDLDEIHLPTLKKMIRKGYKDMKKKYVVKG